MIDANARELREQLDQLRTELIELAYSLDRRSRPDAADVAMTTAARIGELCHELAGEPQGRLGA